MSVDEMSPEEIRSLQMSQLKEAAKIFLRPMERLPFPVVIEAMTGFQILPIAADRRRLLRALVKSCIAVTAESIARPVIANRPNDVSAQVERLLLEQLKSNQLLVEYPVRSAGKGGGGYPDFLLRDRGDPAYLEVKVSREQNIAQGSARNFFYQPSANGKIRFHAPHILAGFAIEEVTAKKWRLTRWKIVDLFFLRVRLKPEYNADNLEIYRDDGRLLVEGNDAKITRGEERIK